MNRRIKRIITYFVIVSFLSQDFLWASDNRMLAPDSRGAMEEIGEALGENPGPDDAWNGFSKGAGVPFRINSDRLAELIRKFGGLCIIKGEVNKSGNFQPSGDVKRYKKIYGGTGFKKIKRKIDFLLEKIGIFDPGTKVNIITDTDRPIFINKRDSSLDIHALFLLDDISDDLLLFCGWHDARHKQIEGVSPLLEEVLNIYMDFEYLDKMKEKDSIRLVSELENLEEGGYASILRKRANRKSSGRDSDNFLNEVLCYIWSNCPWIIEGLKMRNISQIRNPAQVLRGLLEREEPYFRLLMKGAGILYKDFPSEIELRLPQLLPEIAGFLYMHMEFFKKLEDGVYEKAEKCRESAIAVEKGWDGVLLDVAEFRGKIQKVYTGKRNFGYLHKETIEQKIEKGEIICGFNLQAGKIIYIQCDLRDNPWAQKLIINKEIKDLWDELQKDLVNTKTEDEIKDFVNRIWDSISTETDTSKVIPSLRTAIFMAKAGASQLAILAVLVCGLELKDVDIWVRKSRLQRAYCEQIIGFLKAYKNISSALNYKIHESRHMAQNAMNLIIQLTEGDPDVLLFAILDKIEYLKSLKDSPDVYEKMADEEKHLLMQTVEMILIPLSDMLGREDLADEMRDLYLKIYLGEIYEDAREQVCEETGLKYEDLSKVMNGVVGIVENVFRDMPDVRITSRVKSPYSAYYKPKEKKDIFGIRFVITGAHSSKELGEIRAKLNKRLQRLFKITQPDMKRLAEKNYNEYDFIAELNPEFPAFKNLNLRLEVQIYPTEDDLMRYTHGFTAHWLYKLEIVLKGHKIANQLFDRDMLDRLYKDFKGGDFVHNLKLVYDALKEWKYIGVIDRNNELRIVRATAESISPDIASAPGIDLFNREFIGLRGIADKQVASNTDPKILKAGLYRVVTRAGGLENEELIRIKANTRKPRTYLLVSQMLGMKLSKNDGQKILDAYLSKHGKGISREQLGRDLFTIKDKQSQDVGLINRAFSLWDLDEFYTLIHLVGKDGEELMLQELIRRAYKYMTGEDPGKVTLDDLRQRFGIKKGLPNINILLYLFTITERGKNYLKEQGFKPNEKDNEKKLLILLDEFGVENLQQLYGRIELNKLLARIIILRLRNLSSPFLSITAKETENVLDDFIDIVNRSGLEILREEIDEDKIILNVMPGRHWLGKIDMVLQELRALDTVENAELIYKEVEKAPMVFKLEITCNNVRDVGPKTEDLFKKLGIVWKSRAKIIEGRKGTFTYDLMCPKDISASELKKIAGEWLGDGKITVNPEKTEDDRVLSVFVPYAAISSFTIGLLISVIILIISIYIIYKNLQKRHEKRKAELAEKWKKYENESAPENSEFLDPFFKEHRIAPVGDIDFEEVLQNMEITGVERVITKASDMALSELRHDFQGYIISGEYEEKEYRFFTSVSANGVVEVWNDIAYEYREGEYISLGSGVLANCQERLMQAVAASSGIKDLPMLVIAAIRDRDILERLCRNNIIAESVIRRFPNGDFPHPSFNHNRYLIMDDNPTARAYYIPMALNGRGLVAKPLLGLISGIDALHELCHAISDYNEELKRRILAHFEKFPNKRLEEMIAKNYGYNAENPDQKVRIIDESFAYTLSEFGCISRPWRELEGLADLRKNFNEDTVSEISTKVRCTILAKIEKYELYNGKSAKRILQELRKRLREVGILWNMWRRGKIKEEYIRYRYYEIVKGVWELAKLPAIRLLDVRFFAEIGLIEPWMNPLELGYSRIQVDNKDFFVDGEYYMRLIEFLIKRSRAENHLHKLFTGEWVIAPFGRQWALDRARRLAWGLIKTGYGILNLEDLKGEYETGKFWSAYEVVSLWNRIATAEEGDSIIERVRQFIRGRKENRRREKRLENLLFFVKEEKHSAIKAIAEREPWIIQAFCERIILEKPKILILDAEALNDRLSSIIKQVKDRKGKVVVVSKTAIDNDDFENRYGYKADTIYIQGETTNTVFAQYIWADIQTRFRASPEDVVAFTSRNGIVGLRELWRNFIKDGLFYIMDGENLYITSSQLHTIQKAMGKSAVSIKSGEQIELLKLFSEEIILEEAGQGELDRSA